MKNRPLILLSLILILACFVSLIVGRYMASPMEIWSMMVAKFSIGNLTGEQEDLFFLITQVRLPRIISAVLVGSALAVSGAVYQAMLMNPLVSPKFLGVLDGASFGAALGIVVLQSWVATQVLSFVFAIVAVAISLLLASMFKRGGVLVLILGGMISSSFFTALSSLLKYLADRESQLPELVYWLMGTFARSNIDTLSHVGLILFGGILFLSFSGKLTNALSMGDDEAKSFGVNVKATRLLLITVATFVCASTVVIAGVIAWVGLVVPHIMRLMFGTDNRLLLPLSAIGGGVFMLITDTLTRSILPMELPSSIATSLIGLPLFVYALYRNKGVWR